jgi:predicted PhzF superfamily epimerase YddE/YHI9
VREHERLERPVAHPHRRGPRRQRVSQGTGLGRAGDISITPDADGYVWVGGAMNTLFRGTALV